MERITIKTLLLAPLLIFLPAQAAHGAGLKDLRTPYTHTSQGEPLTALLSDFAISQGYSAAFTPRVAGTVSGEFSAVPPLSFLASTRAGHGVEAYTLGSVMHFFHQSERRREVLRINSMPPSEMRQALLRLGALSADLPSDTSKREKLLFIEGPEDYLAGLAASIRAMEDMQLQEQAIRIFPLKHAWADDTSVESATGSTVIPGVASVLRAIATGQPSPVARTLHRSGGGQGQPLPGLSRSGVAGTRETQNEPAPAVAPGPGPNIVAEPRSNAVIVTDTRSRMAYYEAVIAELDKPLDLVEIHVAIVDIAADYAHDLGVRWGGQRQQGEFAGSAAGLGSPSLAAPDASGFTMSAIYQNALNSFWADIRALEERGAGAVLSRPSVLTTDNVQASMESTTTFYVKLTGDKSAELVPVTSGTILKVTPRILRMPGGQPSRLALTIVISDGANSGAADQVDSLPQVSRMTINTQATVAEGQSLLLGGFYHEQRRDKKAGVPGLMNVPVAGALFGQTGANVTRTERLILISPRIITYSALEAPIPERVADQRFAMSPTAADYELKDREDFFDVRPKGCSQGAVRPTKPAGPLPAARLTPGIP